MKKDLKEVGCLDLCFVPRGCASPIGPLSNVFFSFDLGSSTHFPCKHVMVLNGGWDASLHFDLMDPLPAIEVWRHNALKVSLK